ncbi:MAG TPA: PIN/TRAM domain-containing protein [Planctomycetaceae bacterium]|nr:PIN/TRAM domain-containing protein [Planctomycetaceae bacterium]
MALTILRILFILVSAGMPVWFISTGLIPNDRPAMMWTVLIAMISTSFIVVVADIAIRRKRLDVISSVYFGLIVGLFFAYVAGAAISPILPKEQSHRTMVSVALAVVICYVCISLLLQTRNDFRFIIPYVEFAKEAKGRRPYILDTSVIIDGRIADVIEANLFDSQLIMPRFVIGELQGIADSDDRLRRGRGRRGLDVLNRLRGNPKVDLDIFDRDLPEFAGQTVDAKLVTLAKHLEGKLVTNDYNLNKIARVQGVDVINLNDVANALKPIFLPGEHIQVRLVKTGEEPGQGVGYLEDGTMVVVEGGREHVNEQVQIAVTSVLQTSAGRMIFGRFEGSAR